MQLEQFDKLEQNVKNIVDFVFKIKIENHKLKNEIASLKKQLENISNEEIKYETEKEEIENWENSFPSEKRDFAVSRLDKVLKSLKNLSKGVELK